MDALGQRAFDWTSFQRLDNAVVVDFLASSAAAFCELGLISRKETDDLRVTLSSIHSTVDIRGKSLLLELEQQQGDFLKILVSRYGVSSLSLNLLRQTLAHRLTETRRILAEWGKLLTQRAELLFNRVFRLYAGEKVERETLYSAVLLEWSTKIADAESLLSQIIDQLGEMNGHEMMGSSEHDQEIDHAVALAQGFKRVIYPIIRGYVETELQKQLSQLMQSLARCSAIYLQQIARNVESEAADAALATTEWFIGEALRIEQPDFTKGSNLYVMEIRRSHLLKTLAGVQDSIIELMTLVSRSLLHSDRRLQEEAQLIPQACRRRLAFEMITSGTTPHHAIEASEALIQYLEKHQIQAKDVLVGELPRIHVALTPSVLETLEGLTSGQSPEMKLYPEKDDALAKLKYLSENFARVLASTTLPLIACLFVLAGCGLKTSPRSEIVEFRPEIPFRDEAHPPPTNGSKQQGSASTARVGSQLKVGS